MRIAVLTLTRDRRDYTKHCFATLREFAGVEYDHYILDQASTDGTQDWLLAQDDLDVTIVDSNVGITKGLNLLLDVAVDPAAYDCLVRVDNDAELLQPDTLRTVCELAVANETIIAPRVLGLLNPPPVLSRRNLGQHGQHVLEETSILGGIFMAVPATLFSQHGYRYDESHPLWGGDEAICGWWRQLGGRCGYLQGFAVNHYLTTAGQVADNPEYFRRRVLEGGPAR